MRFNVPAIQSRKWPRHCITLFRNLDLWIAKAYRSGLVELEFLECVGIGIGVGIVGRLNLSERRKARSPWVFRFRHGGFISPGTVRSFAIGERLLGRFRTRATRRGLSVVYKIPSFFWLKTISNIFFLWKRAISNISIFLSL